jgi:hypothetical protein
MELEEIIAMHNTSYIYHASKNIEKIKKEGKIKCGQEITSRPPAYKKLVYFSLTREHNLFYNKEKLPVIKIKIDNNLHLLRSRFTIDEDLITDFFCKENKIEIPSTIKHPMYPDEKMFYIIKFNQIPSLETLIQDKDFFIKKLLEKKGEYNVKKDKVEELYDEIVKIFSILKMKEVNIPGLSTECLGINESEYIDFLNNIHDINNQALYSMKLKLLKYYNNPPIAIYDDIDLSDFLQTDVIYEN